MSKSSAPMTDPDLSPNPTPGEVLLEDFLKPMGLSPSELARVARLMTGYAGAGALYSAASAALGM